MGDICTYTLKMSNICHRNKTSFYQHKIIFTSKIHPNRSLERKECLSIHSPLANQRNSWLLLLNGLMTRTVTTHHHHHQNVSGQQQAVAKKKKKKQELLIVCRSMSIYYHKYEVFFFYTQYIKTSAKILDPVHNDQF